MRGMPYVADEEEVVKQSEFGVLLSSGRAA
jgi:hypothetical protein